MQLKGLSPDEPIVENEQGGKQAHTPYGFHLVDPKAMFKLAEVLNYGATKYERDNWRKIPAEIHLNHALQHAYAWLAGDRQDDHEGHFFCRAMMFLAMAISESENK